MGRDTKLLIVEGPDGAGKTTLIVKLQAQLAGTQDFYHHGAYLDVRQNLMAVYLEPLIRPRVDTLIYDRSWLAEPIYGHAMRNGEDRVGVAGRRQLERVALARRGIVILALPPIDVCLATFRRRRDREYLDAEAKLRTVHAQYAALGAGLLPNALPVAIYDYTDPTSSVDLTHTAVEIFRPFANRGPGIGNWHPGGVTLVVGERLNDPTAITLNPALTFVSPTAGRGGCGAWLAERLDELGVAEDQLYWINARRIDDTPTSAEFLDHLQPIRIVALGKVAAAWAQTYAPGLDVMEIDHPQYWKRFHHHEPWVDLRRAFNHLDLKKEIPA